MLGGRVGGAIFAVDGYAHILKNHNIFHNLVVYCEIVFFFSSAFGERHAFGFVVVYI